ncbi:MAG: methyltransferase domain-containing protein [Acidobacteria bacterium]|nr:methyltransferase domain-containing protein [Acidobacteriota bacterium]
MRRARWFRETFRIGPDTKILDLGSESGDNISSVLDGLSYEPSNIYIADIDNEAVLRGADRYGFVPVILGEQSLIPFDDGFFDIVFCSSVIEHVTVEKSEVWEVRDARRFDEIAVGAQKRFADEIRRVGKGYFVQTPARSFPIESHSWLPFAGQLPRRLLLPVLKLTNRFWIKRTIPDFALLSPRELAAYFPDAELRSERFWGLVKSVTAIKTN